MFFGPDVNAVQSDWKVLNFTTIQNVIWTAICFVAHCGCDGEREREEKSQIGLMLICNQMPNLA